jgi:hypothetical protein
MINMNLKTWDDRRELTYDIYPNDKRLKKAGQPINYQQAARNMGYNNNHIESYRRELAYDFDPGNMKSS